MNKEKCMAACNAVLDMLEKDFNIGVGWLEMLNVIAEGCVTIPEPQKFDPGVKAKSLSFGSGTTGSLRNDIDELQRDFRGTTFPQALKFSLFARLLDIVDRLEQRPPSIINFTPTPLLFPTLPTIQPQPWQPPTKPFIGDPPGWFPGSGTVCGTSKSQSVNDATGVSNEEPL